MPTRFFSLLKLRFAYFLIFCMCVFLSVIISFVFFLFFFFSCTHVLFFFIYLFSNVCQSMLKWLMRVYSGCQLTLIHLTSLSFCFCICFNINIFGKIFYITFLLFLSLSLLTTITTYFFFFFGLFKSY